jgi:diguanylate cyclase (GGDEF)-like protein
MLELAGRHGRPLTMLYIDIDHFKAVNDTHGHARGDALLRRIGAAMRTCLRSSDVVGRLGGDEFAVLLPETDANGARAGATKIRDHLWDLFQKEGWPVTTSIGAVVFLVPPDDVDKALQLADACMYRVKNGGKDGFFLLEWKG